MRNNLVGPDRDENGEEKPPVPTLDEYVFVWFYIEYIGRKLL